MKVQLQFVGFNFKFTMFYLVSEFSLAHSEIIVSPYFSVRICGLLENLRGSRKGHGSRSEPLRYTLDTKLDGAQTQPGSERGEIIVPSNDVSVE